MSDWLSYSQNEGSLQLPCVSVETAKMPSRPIAEQVEAICKLIAEHQNGNPLGLFCHPGDNVETQLRFMNCARVYHETVVALLETMYEYCNNPMHLHFDIETSEDLSVKLNQFIKQHLLPFTRGGLIANDRGKASCLIASLKQS